MKTAKTQPMTAHPAYVAAREQATKLSDQLAKLDQEIETLNASRNKTAGNWLASGLSAIAGDTLVGPKLEELTRRRNAIYYAISPAHRAIGDAIRQASREYYASQAPATLAAMDGLIAALDGVQVACNAFKTIRDTGDSLGFDSDAAGIPVGADEQFSVWVKENLPELKRDADRLRDLLDQSLDDATVTILALVKINIYGINLKVGEMGDIKARYARELIRTGSAEESSPGRARLSKLNNLIGA